MGITKISVWYDETSDDHCWIVDECDDGGGTNTLSTHEEREDAIATGEQVATDRGLPLVEIDIHGAEKTLQMEQST